MEQIKQGVSHFKLCWLRESGPDRLRADLGIGVSAGDLPLALMGLLPEQRLFDMDAALSVEQISIALRSWERFASSPNWFQRLLTVFFGRARNAREFETLRSRVRLMESIAVRIRALSDRNPQPHGEIEVHLPQLNRSTWPARFDILGNTAFVRRGGRIYPRNINPDSFDNAAKRVASSIYSGSPNYISLALEGTCDIGRPFIHNLNGHYRTSVPRFRNLCVARVGVSGEAADSWRRLSVSNGTVFSRCITRFAFALQSMLRGWVPGLCLADDDSWSNRDLVTDMLVYCATPPFANAPQHLAYDVMDPDHTDLIRMRLRRRMPGLWQRMRDHWVAEENSDLAGRFAPRFMASATEEAMDRALHQKRYRGLLVAEGGIAQAVANFVRAASECPGPRRLPAVIRNFDQVLRVHLQRLVPNKPQRTIEFLRTLVLLEASNSFHCGLGGESSLNARFEDERGNVYDNSCASSMRPVIEELDAAA
ncbi:MAG: hypothetical protein ACKV2U_28865 [Bryobacteraceae bacterium]